MTTPQVPGLPVPDAVAGGLLLSRYQNSQQLVSVRAALAIRNLWIQMISPRNFSATWKRYQPVVNGIIDTHYQMTAANAAEYYGHARVVAGNRPVTIPGVTLDPEYLVKETGMMGPGQFYHFLEDHDPDTASAMARDSLQGAGARMVMNGGRDTVTKAAAGDPMAEGWERVIEPGACGFCAMLAGRGAVYKETTVSFRAHDHCHCVARAVFIGQESVNREIGDQWAEATKGTRGKAAIAAWNKYWESRHGTDIGATAKESPEARAGNAPIAIE